MWTSVLQSKYGDLKVAVDECREGKVRDKSWSSWWRDLMKFVGCSSWFWLGLRKIVGDGKNTSFWEDRWLGGNLRLRDMFPRLFSLETEKHCLIASRLNTVNNVNTGVWSWRRRLFVWEEKQVEELTNLVNRYSLNSEKADGWSWSFSKGTNYTVKEGYEQILKEKDGSALQLESWTSSVWNKWVPTKINAFVWRLVLDRIPSLPNLQRRNIISLEELICCRLCDEEKTEDSVHLFFTCRFASKIWLLLLNWLDHKMETTDNVKNFLRLFSKSFKGKTRMLWDIFWHCAVWNIWIARNKMILKGEAVSAMEVFETIKFNVWTWVKNRGLINTSYNFADWECFPKMVLNISYNPACVSIDSEVG